MPTFDHLSFSQVLTYLQCPLKYYFRYIALLEPAFVASALVFGQSVHAALAQYFQSVLEGEPMEGSDLMGALGQEWKFAQEQNVPILFSGKEDYHSLLETGWNLVNHFQKNYPPKPIVGIEEEFTLDLGGGIPPLIGRIDLLEEDKGLSVIDLKTASKRPTASQVENDLQLTIYAQAAMQMGWTNRWPTVKWAVLTKTQLPKLYVLESTRTKDDWNWARQLIHGVWKGIDTEVFYPSPSYLLTSGRVERTQ